MKIKANLADLSNLLIYVAFSDGWYQVVKISPYPSLPKRGIITPFGKGRAGGI